MKKVLTFAMALVMLLTIAACGAKKVPAGGESPNAGETPTGETPSQSGEILTQLDSKVDIQFWHTYTDTHLERL